MITLILLLAGIAIGCLIIADHRNGPLRLMALAFIVFALPKVFPQLF